MCYKCNFLKSIQFDKKYEKLNWSDFNIHLSSCINDFTCRKGKIYHCNFYKSKSIRDISRTINKDTALWTSDIRRNIYPLCTLRSLDAILRLHIPENIQNIYASLRKEHGNVSVCLFVFSHENPFCCLNFIFAIKYEGFIIIIILKVHQN